MSSGGFILAINLFVASLFAVAFFLVAATNRADRAAIWFGFAYVFGAGYVTGEFLLPLQIDPKLTGFFAFASFLAASACITAGIAHRYRMGLEWPLFGAAVVLALAVNWFAFDLGRDSLLRMLLYQAPYALLLALCAFIVLRSRRRQPADRALFVLCVLSTLQFIFKPFIALAMGGPGASPQQYAGTIYALFSQTLGSLLSVAIGVLLLVMLVRDLLLDVTAQTETDALSGLYNRRGFEDRAAPDLIAAGRGGVPAALIACDLDHFKSINDAYGHVTGDRVIAAFGQLLKSTAPARSTAGRLGGEEFAVFLPGANLGAARLYAESLRSAFATTTLSELPPDARFTASFGVAESEGMERLSELRRRAVAALHAAKKAGRNRVVTAPPGLQDAMPSHPFSPAPPHRGSRRPV